MDPKLTPTVVSNGPQFGRLLRSLRLLEGWSQERAGAAYHCVSALVSFRETGKRNITVPDAVTALRAHGYVLVVMHQEDALDVPRLTLVTDRPERVFTTDRPCGCGAPPADVAHDRTARCT